MITGGTGEKQLYTRSQEVPGDRPGSEFLGRASMCLTNCRQFIELMMLQRREISPNTIKDGLGEE